MYFAVVSLISSIKLQDSNCKSPTLFGALIWYGLCFCVHTHAHACLRTLYFTQDQILYFLACCSWNNLLSVRSSFIMVAPYLEINLVCLLILNWPGGYAFPILRNKEFNYHARRYCSCKEYGQGSDMATIGHCLGWGLASILSLCIQLPWSSKITISLQAIMHLQLVTCKLFILEVLYITWVLDQPILAN